MHSTTGSPSNRGRGTITGVSSFFTQGIIFVNVIFPSIYHGNYRGRGGQPISVEFMGGRGRGFKGSSALSISHLPQSPAKLRPLVMWVEFRHQRAQSGGLHKEASFPLVSGLTSRGCPLREEMSERYERAAAVSVFRGDMKRGIMTLTDGANLARQQGNEEKGGYFNPHTFTTLTPSLPSLPPQPPNCS